MKSSSSLLPIKALPQFDRGSPRVVKVLDKIRFAITPDQEHLAEFAWFAREYPRCFRYHCDCAEHRLRNVYRLYQDAHTHFSGNWPDDDQALHSVAYGGKSVMEIYWEFDSYLNSINSALDILARIVGLAYKQKTSPSFNRLCKNVSGGPAVIFQRAKEQWVSRMKDYRDCFVHYTPVETALFISVSKYADGWQVRAPLPRNPNARDIVGFKWSRHCDVLTYALKLHGRFKKIDRDVAREIAALSARGEFPKKTEGLFFIGRRECKGTTTDGQAESGAQAL